MPEVDLQVRAMGRRSKNLKMFLNIVEEANFDYDKVKETITARVKQYQRNLKELSQMSDEQFTNQTSNAVFGIASRTYWESRDRETVQELEEAIELIDHFMDLWKNDRRMLEWVIRHSYAGSMKRVARAINKLAESRFNSRLFGASSVT
jgi:uncharacterized protein YjiS (DUF1127 family)